MAALVVTGLVGVEAAPASAAPTTPPAATFIQCTDKGPTTSVYALVGGPSHPTPTPRSCKSLPVVPADGTFIRGVKAVKNSAGTITNWAWTGSTYEVIGGAPITVHGKKQVAGAKHAVVLKHLPRGQRVQVRVKANNLYGFGPSSKKSTAVRVR